MSEPSRGAQGDVSPPARPAVVSEPLTRAQRIFYAVVRSVVVGAARLWFRVEVVGRDRIPTSGACVLAPAHRSNLDTPLLASVTRRPLRYMGKDSLWRAGRFATWFLNSLGGFPVARGSADREALRAAQAVLERGEPLVMFPEGTRRAGPVIHELYNGPAFVAARTGAPIIPIGIGGSEAAMPKGVKLPRPRKIVFVVGEPIPAPVRTDGGRAPRTAVTELTVELHGRIQELFDDAQRRAGSPDVGASGPDVGGVLDNPGAERAP